MPLTTPKLLQDRSEWDTYYGEYDVFKQEAPNKQWGEWQKQILDEFLKFQDEEKTRRGITVEEDVPESVRRVQLKSIVNRLSNIPAEHHTELIEQILDDQYRMGPAQSLWEKKMVSDIQIFVPYSNQYPQIIAYTERGERKLYHGPGFRNFDHARDWVNLHLSRIRLRYDPKDVQLDGMFPNGERIHVISGSCGYSMFSRKDKKYLFVNCMIISIRRFVSSFDIDDLTEPEVLSKEPPVLPLATSKQLNWERSPIYQVMNRGMADRATMDFLRLVVKMGINYIVSGGTGVGKTTFANALTQAIPSLEVLLILEEAPEMQPQCGLDPELPVEQQEAGMVIRIFQREDLKFNLEKAMKGALRMFPDRIFIAELRDQLAFVFLQAIQSGHDGSSTTVHSSDCLSAIERILDMASTHPSAPSREMIQKILFDRVGVILHGKRDNGKRFLDEVIQLKPDGSVHKVMEFIQEGTDSKGRPIGYWAFYGPTDEFIRDMMRKGHSIPESWGWKVQEGNEVGVA